MNSKNSQARVNANNKYVEKAYDRISIIVPKGEKDKIKKYADKEGMSLNAFIVASVKKATDCMDFGICFDAVR